MIYNVIADSYCDRSSRRFSAGRAITAFLELFMGFMSLCTSMLTINGLENSQVSVPDGKYLIILRAQGMYIIHDLLRSGKEFCVDDSGFELTNEFEYVMPNDYYIIVEDSIVIAVVDKRNETLIHEVAEIEDMENGLDIDDHENDNDVQQTIYDVEVVEHEDNYTVGLTTPLEEAIYWYNIFNEYNSGNIDDPLPIPELRRHVY